MDKLAGVTVCEYCHSRNYNDRLMCSQCGAPLPGPSTSGVVLDGIPSGTAFATIWHGVCSSSAMEPYFIAATSTKAEDD